MGLPSILAGIGGGFLAAILVNVASISYTGFSQWT
jgi:hypothetical protein